MLLFPSHTVQKNVLEEKYEASHAQLFMKFLPLVFFLAFVISGGVSAPLCRAPLSEEAHSRGSRLYRVF